MKIASIEVNLFGERTYIVWDEKTLEAAVIDPGMSDEREQRAFDLFIEKNKLKITHLLYTHLHIDHTLGHEHVTEKYGVKSEANVGDAMLGQNRAQQSAMFHLRIPTPKPLEIDKKLTDGQKIYLGEDYLEVIEVPGHSQGSVAYYSPQSHFVITGDALFRGSIGRTDLPGGNQGQLINSIRTKLLTLPPHTVVYPGHGPATTIEAEMQSNPFL